MKVTLSYALEWLGMRLWLWSMRAIKLAHRLDPMDHTAMFIDLQRAFAVTLKEEIGDGEARRDSDPDR